MAFVTTGKFVGPILVFSQTRFSERKVLDQDGSYGQPRGKSITFRDLRLGDLLTFCLVLIEQFLVKDVANGDFEGFFICLNIHTTIYDCKSHVEWKLG